MSRARTRKPLPGPEYRYDAWGRVIRRKRPSRGSYRFRTRQQVTADLSGNNRDFIYFDIPAQGNTTNCITVADVEKMRRLADASGNPKTWTAGEHSQEFLRSLIPGM